LTCIVDFFGNPHGIGSLRLQVSKVVTKNRCVIGKKAGGAVQPAAEHLLMDIAKLEAEKAAKR
jgi:hypothetical protein